MPEGPTFQSWYPPATMEQVHAFLDDLHGTYGSTIINARDWVAEEDFSDSHHAMRRGAAVFSERLARDVLLPLLRELPR